MTQAVTLAGLASSGALSADSSGNVGIGTSATTYNYQTKNIALYDATSAGISVVGGAKILTLTAQNAGGVFVGARSNDALIFATNDTERARIDTSGNFILTNTGNNRFYSTGVFNVTNGAAANMIVTSDGGFARSTSSLKYKKNVNDSVRGLSDLLKLRAITYESKNETEAGIVFGGLIAEEVHEAGLTEFVQYAEDGTPDALAYGNMVSLCIKAIQEQQAMIEELKAKVAALEAR